jgi:hypothetical protein
MGTKISRKTQKIFASTSGASGIAEFGSTAAGSTVFTTDLAVIQSTEFEEGLAGGIIAGSKRLPVYEEINGVYYTTTKQLAYLFENGIPEWDAGTEYFITSIVRKTGTYELYGSVGNNNLGNALPSAVTDANWTYLGVLSNLSGSYLPIAGGTVTGAINEAAYATVASASTADIGAAASNNVSITGTTTITSFGTIAAGATRSVRFTGALTLTHNATSLILPSAANITTAAGDTLTATSLGSGNWVVTSYTKASGEAIASSNPHVNEFRLTLTSATPVTTSDVTGATTIYAAPYKGNSISLYNGTSWVMRTSAQFSLALGTLSNNTNYDVFCYDNSGTPTLEFVAWTNDTTRATALTYQDGVLVKTGATTRRYMGTFRTTSTTTTEDSVTKRFVYNYSNRVRRDLFKTDSTASWTYTTATLRQANAAAANQVEAIQGVAEDTIEIQVSAAAKNTSAPVGLSSGIGIDSTTVNSSLIGGSDALNSECISHIPSRYAGVPSAGYHKYCWLEYSVASGTTTWYGTSGIYKSGIFGSVFA